MPATDFVQRITQGAQEIAVCRDDSAVHVELDYGLRLPDRGNLARKIGGAQLLFGDVGRKLDDLEGLLLLVKNGIVAREDPDLLAALADALVLRRGVFATIEFGPEFPIFGTVAHGRFGKHAVMLALDFRQRVTHRLQEILVRRNDGAIHVEFDDGLSSQDCINLAGILHASDLFRRHVGCELNDLAGLAIRITNRIVRRLDPDLFAALADALVFRCLIFTAIELGPELAISGTLALGWLDKHAVVFALNFHKRVAERLEEVFVGDDDGAVHVEFDHRLRFPDRCGLRQRVAGGRAGSPRKHFKLLFKLRESGAKFPAASGGISASPRKTVSSVLGTRSHSLDNISLNLLYFNNLAIEDCLIQKDNQ